MFKYILLFLTVSCVYSATQVFSCDDGEYVDSGKCKVCPLHCTKCTSSSVCTACEDTYFLYTADNTCQLKTLITIDNCIDLVDKAAATKVCKTCATGFWLKSDKTCVAVALTTCLTWKSAVATEACATFKCSEIHAKCTSCSSGTVCTGCDSGYFLSTDSVCTAITGNCLTWKKSETEECDTCPTGYTKYETKFCIASQCLNSVNNSITCGNQKARSSAPFCNVTCFDATNCEDCQTEAESQCLVCKANFLLFGGKCYAEIAHCATLNATDECSACSTGYTLLSNVCEKNKENCSTMATADNCATCSPGYYLDLNACNTQCTAHCTCTAAEDKCTGCQEGYRYDAGAGGVGDGTCTQCTNVHCLACAAAIGTCTSCASGYTKISNDCIENLAHCSEMDSSTLCKTCSEGYGLATDKLSCKSCVDENCKTCATEGKTCSVCNTGYYVDKTKADTADVDAVCVQCTKTNAKYVITTCTDTQRVNFPWLCADLTGNCAANDPTPLIGEAAQSCKACSPGYRLNAGVCTVCTPENCYQCDADVTKCAECNFGYYMKDDACVACDATTCQKCSSTECLDCKPKYGFQSAANKVCLACTELNEAKTACTPCSTNCTSCLDGATCYVCQEQSYLDGKVCKGCFENCKTCTSATACTACMTGFEFNSDKTACTKSTTATGTGRECLTTVTGCMKCDATTSTTCALCDSGSAPIAGKCTCADGELLIAGACVTQSTDALPEAYTEKTLAELQTYVTKALASDTKTTVTKNILARLSTILTAGKTNENAGKSLQLLLQFADAASEAQESYSAIITTACGITELSQTNFQVALAAADKVMSNATDKKGIYQLGFETCVTNLLKNVGTLADISPMKMANSEFTMKKFSKTDTDKKLELTGVTATMNEDFLTAVGEGDFYATFQAIPNTVNPYASEQTNTKFALSSKIVSFSVRTAGASSAAKTVTLATDKTFPIEFDAGTSGKCSYYKTADKKWTEDGTLTGKTCAFSHLTDFAIYKDVTDGGDDGDNAYMLQVLSIMLIFIVAMF